MISGTSENSRGDCTYLALMKTFSQTRTNTARGGFSLVELMVVFTIITIALSMFSQTLTSASRLDPMAKETAMASEAARNMIETMRGQAFDDVFATSR